jgi:hypothetical protein
MKNNVFDILADKSKNKKDGIYTYGNYKYKVKDNNLTHYIGWGSNQYCLYGITSDTAYSISEFEYKSNAEKALKNIK